MTLLCLLTQLWGWNFHFSLVLNLNFWGVPSTFQGIVGGRVEQFPKGGVQSRSPKAQGGHTPPSPPPLWTRMSTLKSYQWGEIDQTKLLGVSSMLKYLNFSDFLDMHVKTTFFIFSLSSSLFDQQFCSTCIILANTWVIFYRWMRMWKRIGRVIYCYTLINCHQKSFGKLRSIWLKEFQDIS